jgi:hypothetical protein
VLADLDVESDELVFAVWALAEDQVKLGAVAFLSWRDKAESRIF